MSTHAFLDNCSICDGSALVNKSTRPPYVSEECYDCGWFETDQPGYEGSGFISFNELNDHREGGDYDPIGWADFKEIRTQINAPLDESENPNPVEADEYALVINRRRASRDL
jgi:hypothetical protein